MAYADPSDEQIGTFIAVTGEAATRDVAITFIRGANGNVDQAINEFFDNPGKYLNQDKYDESAWSQDRHGEWNNQNIPAFQIDYATNDQYPSSNAPTRPPSRISQNSSTKGIPGSPLTGHDDTWGQESGIIGSGTQFGPANQEKYYDNSSWAMTWTGGSSAAEAYSDPIPMKRRRKPSQPAFLKPLGSGDYLPSLITILHAISLGHYALGLDGESISDYDYHPDWWHGDTSGITRVVSIDPSDEPADHGKEFLAETQKLMAFLDATTRSYGSAATLVESKVLEDSAIGGISKTYCDRFLLAWEAHAARLLPNLMPEMCIFKSQAVYRMTPRAVPSLSPFCTIVLTLTNRGNGQPSNLYDELDDTIWSGDLEGKSEVEQSIMHPAPILCIRVEQPDTFAADLNFEVPLTWYADRYLHENEQQAKRMRQDTAQQRISLQQIDEMKEQTTNFTSGAGKTMNIAELLQTAQVAYGPPPPLLIDDEGEPEIAMDTASKKYDLAVLETRPDAIGKLEIISKNIERKLVRLEQEKEKIKAAIERGRSLLKERTDDQQQRQPTERYNLCGFATDACTTYILKRAKEQLVEMGDAEAEQDQWWKLHYPSGDDPRIEKEKVNEADIPSLARFGTRDVLLVYAVDKALSDVDTSWPSALQRFIQADNEAFRAEIANTEMNSLSQLPGPSDEDIPDLIPWEQPEKPPAYASADAGISHGFAPFEGKLSDLEYGGQEMEERATAAKARSEPMPLISLDDDDAEVKTVKAENTLQADRHQHVANSDKGDTEGSATDSIDLVPVASQGSVQHLEFARPDGA